MYIAVDRLPAEQGELVFKVYPMVVFFMGRTCLSVLEPHASWFVIGQGLDDPIKSDQPDRALKVQPV